MIKSNKSFLDLSSCKTVYFIVFFLAAALYISTMAPGPVWQDSGMLQYRVWNNDIEGKLGLALSHPLFYILAIGAKSIPVGQLIYRINLVSAIAAAIAVANLFLLLRLWLGKNFPAIIAAVTLALSHTFWRHACLVETYNLYIAFFLAGLIMLLRYVQTRRVVYLYWLGLCNGLEIATHMFGSIPLLCYAVFLIVLLVRKNIRFKDLAIFALFWIIGAGPYEYLVIKNLIQTGDVVATFSSALFGNSWQGDVLNTSVSAGIIKQNLMLMAYNFSTPNVLFFIAGLYGIKKMSPGRGFKNVLLGLLILFFIFAFRYTVKDRYTFFIPFYCVVAIIAGCGFMSAIAPGRKMLCGIIYAFILMPIPVYFIAPVIAQKVQFSLPTRGDIPYRNDYIWFLRPWKSGYKGTVKFAEDIFSTVEKDAVVYADNTTVYPLLYLQEIKEKRKDIKIISSIVSSKNTPLIGDENIEQVLSGKPIYVLSPRLGYCPTFLLEQYEFKQTGILWKAIIKADLNQVD